MGTSQSSPFLDELAGYKVIQKIPENNITHLSHIETDKQYLLRQLTYNDEKLFRKHLDEHKSRQSITDDHLIHLVRVEGKQIDHLCSNLYKIYAIWEYPYRFLNEEINERSYQNRKFQDKQISSILASSIFALSTLQKNKIKHQMLTTRTILLDSQGLIKIADPLACGSSTNFDTVHRNRNIEDVYISPEQCQALELKGAYSNPFKSDVWVLGLIILECGLLENMSRCYKDEYQRIDFDLINTKLNQFGRQYGQQLKLVVQQMLKHDNKDRPDWIDLAQYARKFKSPFVDPASKFSSEKKQSNEVSNYKNGLSPNSHQDQTSFYIPQLPSNQNQIPTTHIFRPSFDPPKESYGQSRPYPTSARPPGIEFRPPIQSTGYNYTTSSYPYGKEITNVQPISTSYTNYQSVPYPPSNVIPKNQNYPIPNTQVHLAPIPYPQTYVSPPEYSSLYSAKQGNLFPSPPDYGSQPKSDETWKVQPPSYGLGQTKFDTYSQISKDPYKLTAKGFEPPKTDVNLVGYSKLDNLSQFRNNQVRFKNLTAQQPTNYGTYLYTTTSPYSVSNFPTSVPPSGNQSIFTPPSFLQSMGFNSNVNKPYLSQVYREPLPKDLIEKQKPIAVKEIGGDLSGDKGYSRDNKNQDARDSNQIIQNTDSLERHVNTVQSNQQNNTYVDYIQRDDYNGEVGAKDSGLVQERPEYVVETFKQGSKYEGYKLKDMRHGQGKFYYQDGGMYDGEWKRNKMDGFGSLYYQSGQLAYQGMWRDDQFQGKGKLYNQYPYALQAPFNYENFDQIQEYWSYYQGDFVEDFKKGKGVLMLSNGEYIEGQFNNDMLDGPGIFHCNDGRIVKGVWRQNHLVSK